MGGGVGNPAGDVESLGDVRLVAGAVTTDTLSFVIILLGAGASISLSRGIIRDEWLNPPKIYDKAPMAIGIKAMIIRQSMIVRSFIFTVPRFLYVWLIILDFAMFFPRGPVMPGSGPRSSMKRPIHFIFGKDSK